MFFAFCQFIYSGDVGVGEFLDFVETVAFVVFGNLFVLEHFLEALVGVAANVAHGGAMIFGYLVHLFGELLAPFLSPDGMGMRTSFGILTDMSARRILRRGCHVKVSRMSSNKRTLPNKQTIAVTLPLLHDVYNLVSQAAASEGRSFEDLLGRLVIEGLDAHASTREIMERVSVEYQARVSGEGKSQQSADEVLQELRELREQIARELYPG